MKPQSSVVQVRPSIWLYLILSGACIPAEALAFRMQNPSDQTQEDNQAQRPSPPPTPPERPQPRTETPAPSPRPRDDPPPINRSEPRQEPRSEPRPQPHYDSQPAPRREERRVDAAPSRPSQAQERRADTEPNARPERSHDSTNSRVFPSGNTEPKRNNFNRSNPRADEQAPEVPNARRLETPRLVNTLQPTTPQHPPGQNNRPSAKPDPGHTRTDGKPDDRGNPKERRPEPSTHGRDDSSESRRHEGNAVEKHDRAEGNRNNWHQNSFPVRPHIVIPNHDNQKRYERPERWHERDRIWTGYNHESRRSWGIHFYDPFYYEWIFCGGRYYYWRGMSYSAYRPYYIWDFDYAPEPYSVAEAQYPSAYPICFPPSIPPLGAPPPTREINPTSTAPGSLLAYLNEPFYASLSTRLLQSSLLQDQKLALYQYRDNRDDELALLQRELELINGVSPEHAQARLLALSEQQTPRLRRLEAQAEQLRGDFMRKGISGLLLGSGNWNERREYYLNLGEGGESETDRIRLDFLMLRAAVFYQDGLSRTQRDLLREASSELQLQTYISRGGVENEDERNQYIYFSPGGVQIPIGPRMPSHIVKMLQVYTDRKTELKDQLIAQLYSLESTSDRRRKESLEAFARGQEHNYLFLENLAEQIRVELTRYPQALDLHTRASSLPKSLVARIDILSEQRMALAQEYEQQFQLFNQSASPAQVRVLNLHVEDPDPDEPPQLTLGAAPRMPEAQRDEIKERLRLFNESNARRHASLRAEQTAIIVEIETALRGSLTMNPPSNATDLFNAELEQARTRDVSDRYNAYRQACLQPGLSIEQRRLLLGSALAHLGMPLPPAE